MSDEYCIWDFSDLISRQHFGVKIDDGHGCYPNFRRNWEIYYTGPDV